MSAYGTPFIPPLATPQGGASNLPPAAQPNGYPPFPGYTPFSYPNSPIAPGGYSPYSPFIPPGVQYTPQRSATPQIPHTPSPNILENGFSADFTGVVDSDSPPPPAFTPPVAGPSNRHYTPPQHPPPQPQHPPPQPQQPPTTSPWHNMAQLPNSYTPAGYPPPGWPQQGGYMPHQSPYATPGAFQSPYGAPQWGGGGGGGNFTPAGNMGAPLPGGYPPPNFIPNGGMGGGYPAFSPGMGAGVLPPSLAGFSPNMGGIGGIGTPGGMGMGMGLPGGMGGGMGGMGGGMGGMGGGMGGIGGSMGMSTPGGGMGMGMPGMQQGGLDAASRALQEASLLYAQAQAQAAAQASIPPPAPEMPMGRGRKGDRMPPFMHGRHYGPVLEPFMIHRVGAKVHLNPILMPMSDNLDDREYLKWDMRHRTNTCQSSKDAGNNSWSNRDQPATFPRTTNLTLVSKAMFYTIKISARDTGIGVTCGEVIEHISYFLHKRVGNSEFTDYPEQFKSNASKAYYINRSTRSDAPGGELGSGMLKMDMLCSKTTFGGIQENERLVRERYYTTHPCTFELVCLEWQLSPVEAERMKARGAQADAQTAGQADIEDLRETMEATSLGARPTRSSSTRSRHSRHPSSGVTPSTSDQTPPFRH